MPDDGKCAFHPEVDCHAFAKTAALEKDISDLKEEIRNIRQQSSATHQRLFDRLNEVEAGEKVQSEQYKQIQEKMDENKSSIAEIKADNKIMMGQLNDILVKITEVDSLKSSVEELKAKPAKRWEELVKQVLSLLVGAVVAIIFVKIGLAG